MYQHFYIYWLDDGTCICSNISEGEKDYYSHDTPSCILIVPPPSLQVCSEGWSAMAGPPAGADGVGELGRVPRLPLGPRRLLPLVRKGLLHLLH